MWDWAIAVSIMVITMGFGWWLQRREARHITNEISRMISEGDENLARLIDEGNKRLEVILTEMGRDVKDIRTRLTS